MVPRPGFCDRGPCLCCKDLGYAKTCSPRGRRTNDWIMRKYAPAHGCAKGAGDVMMGLTPKGFTWAGRHRHVSASVHALHALCTFASRTRLTLHLESLCQTKTQIWDILGNTSLSLSLSLFLSLSLSLPLSLSLCVCACVCASLSLSVCVCVCVCVYVRLSLCLGVTLSSLLSRILFPFLGLTHTSTHTLP
jgi:hypothetical protein